MNYNLNVYTSKSIKNVDYETILNLPIRYPEFVIVRPLADEYLFYSVPGKRFGNYNKLDKNFNI